RETEETMQLIFRIRDDGLAVVVIEHDMRFIFGLCDRVLCLVRGALLVEGTPTEVQSDHRVIEAYIGGDDDADDDGERDGESAGGATARGGEAPPSSGMPPLPTDPTDAGSSQ
ncbi:MAG TPA: hypothetical protein VES95_12150, partial [Dermatophilaceae bacterium]|nr:hypothetical protein [Dermatophilaceae bacterium]